ncbi:MAG: hypothetical protein ACLU38_07130 [Dysosmobacter sp.]
MRRPLPWRAHAASGAVPTRTSPSSSSRDGVEALHTPGDGKLDSAVYAALGRDFARSAGAGAGLGRGHRRCAGFVTAAAAMGRGSRSMQVFFVNGRFIKSQLLTAALGGGLPQPAHRRAGSPAVCWRCLLPVTAVDVNVHPAEDSSEVRPGA